MASNHSSLLTWLVSCVLLLIVASSARIVVLIDSSDTAAEAIKSNFDATSFLAISTVVLSLCVLVLSVKIASIERQLGNNYTESGETTGSSSQSNLSPLPALILFLAICMLAVLIFQIMSGN